MSTLVEQLRLLEEAPLVTSRYSDWRPGWGVPLRVTLGPPRFWTKRFPLQPLTAVAQLAPTRAVFHEPSDDVAKQMYFDHLDRQGDKAIERLALIARQYPGERLVAMCFENVHAGQVCHRTWMAEWFEDRHGLAVPELDPQAMWFR